MIANTYTNLHTTVKLNENLTKQEIIIVSQMNGHTVPFHQTLDKLQ